MSFVFLSHSHQDKEFARRVAADLRAAGHNVWIDEAEIRVGDSLIEKIREGLDQVDYVAAVISSSSIESNWVKRELDIASNKEIEEGRVVVLPLLVERVEMPGFLKGKFYADFTDEENYTRSIDLVIESLGPAEGVPEFGSEEVAEIQSQLDAALAQVAKHEKEIQLHRDFAMRGKSEELVQTIERANKEHPEHAPINSTYAFEAGGSPVVLDYLLWSAAKAQRDGSHPLEIMLTLDEKWGEAKAMLSAYADMIRRLGAN